MLRVDAGVELWNSTDGLCGRMDGSRENDLSPHNSAASFASKWLVNGVNDVFCDSPVADNLNVSKDVIREAFEFCSAMERDQFKSCDDDKHHLDTRAYMEACKTDYIRCNAINGTDCGCDSVSAYAEECFGRDQKTLWRKENLCR